MARKIDMEIYEKFEYDKYKYEVSYIDELKKNATLQRENGYLKALFEKEEDTQVIKYQGKLYRIVSMAHFTEVDESDTLDINAVCVEEVSKDGKSKM